MSGDSDTGEVQTFEDLVRTNVGCAVILAGSGSDDKCPAPDRPSHIERIALALQRYGIPYEVRIASAHKQGKNLLDIVRYYDTLPGALAYIAVAGNTDALSGTTSFRSFRPTISCPPDHSNQSCIQNPPGSSNAYVGRPENAARFVAQMFSHFNETYRTKLAQEISEKINDLEKDDARVRAKYAQQQGREA